MELPKRFKEKASSELATEVVDTVKESYESPKKTQGGLVIDLKKPNIFVNMLKYTITKHDSDFMVTINSGNKTVGYLGLEKNAAKASKENFLYSYNNKATRDPLTYQAFGEQLKKYSPEVVEKIATVVLKMMRVDSRLNKNELAAKQTETDKLLTELESIDKAPGASRTAIELVAELVGAAACEAGRAPNGYLNLFSSLHRIKHEARTINQKIAFDIEFMDSKKDKVQEEAIIKQNGKSSLNKVLDAIFPTSYEADADTWRNAAGFSGSQNIMRTFAKLENLFKAWGKDSDIVTWLRREPVWKQKTVKEYNDAVNDWVKRYSTMVERDAERMGNWKSTNPERKKYYEESETTNDETMYRKIIRHLKAALTSVSENREPIVSNQSHLTASNLTKTKEEMTPKQQNNFPPPKPVKRSIEIIDLTDEEDPSMLTTSTSNPVPKNAEVIDLTKEESNSFGEKTPKRKLGFFQEQPNKGKIIKPNNPGNEPSESDENSKGNLPRIKGLGGKNN